MKKKIAMTVMALAVSAMAGSAFAAENVPGKKIELPAQMNMITLTTATPAINLEQMAKDKGITVKELIAQLEKEGKLTKAVKLVKGELSQKNSDGNVPMTKLFTLDEAKTMTNATYAVTKTINLEDMAKEKGMTVEELIAQLEEEGKISKAMVTGEAQPLDQDGNSMMNIISLANSANDEEGTAMIELHTISLEELAKSKGMTLEELIAQLKIEGAIIDAAPTTPAAKN